MTHETNILRDLAAGQSTADSLAPRIRLSPTATEAVLLRLLASGQITKHSISIRTAVIPVYRLTKPSTLTPQ